MPQVCTGEALVEAAKCFRAIPTEMEMAVLIKVFCEIANMNCTAESLVESSKCFHCIPKEMRVPALLYLSCQILNNGVQPSSGETCIVCGDGAPTEEAPCDCSIYYSNPPNSGVWVWNATASAWECIINPGV